MGKNEEVPSGSPQKTRELYQDLHSLDELRQVITASTSMKSSGKQLPHLQAFQMSSSLMTSIRDFLFSNSLRASQVGGAAPELLSPRKLEMAVMGWFKRTDQADFKLQTSLDSFTQKTLPVNT